MLASHLINGSVEVPRYTARGRTRRKLTLSGEKGDGGALLASTACSADAMNIILRIVGIVIVQHVSNVSHILKERLARRSKFSLRGSGTICGRVSGDASLSLSEENVEHDPQRQNVHVPGVGNRLRSSEEILDLQLWIVKRGFPRPARVHEAEMEIKTPDDPGPLQKRIQDSLRKDQKNRAWTKLRSRLHNEHRERAPYHTTAMVRKPKGEQTQGGIKGGEGRGLLDHTDTTRCDIRSNHDRALAGLEFVENPITFVLLLVAVNS